MRRNAKRRGSAAKRDNSGYRSGRMTQARKPRKPAGNTKGGPRTHGRFQQALDDAARREIEAALKETSGNVSESARVLGVGRPRLWARMKALGIVPRR